MSGLGVGAMTAIAPSYVAESAPTALRGRIVGFFQVITVLGVRIHPPRPNALSTTKTPDLRSPSVPLLSTRRGCSAQG
jgi:hypothetical protein